MRNPDKLNDVREIYAEQSTTYFEDVKRNSDDDSNRKKNSIKKLTNVEH